VNHESSFSGAEIVGVAAVAAASLGGIIVALGRSHAGAAKSNAPALASVPDVARHQLEHGRAAARSAAAAVADAYPGIRESAAELLSRAVETAGPQAGRASEAAAARAKTARTTGTQAIERLQDVVIPAAAGALGSIREHASDATAKSTSPAAGVVARSGEIADAAVAKSGNAMRETAALLFWLSAAFSLVYFVLLNEERREKLRSFAIGAYEQTRLLAQDFQGYDEDV
jgi:hypothetical protein